VAALARPFAIALALAASTFVLIAVLLWARSGFATPPYVFMRGPGGMIAFLLAVTTQVVCGFLLAIRRPDLPIGRLALTFAVVVGLALLANAYLAFAEHGLEVPWDPAWIAWFTSWFAFPGAALTAVVLGLVFPDHKSFIVFNYFPQNSCFLRHFVFEDKRRHQIIYFIGFIVFFHYYCLVYYHINYLIQGQQIFLGMDAFLSQNLYQFFFRDLNVSKNRK